MARKVVVYDSFEGGEFGRYGAWKAPKASWTGSNMMVYRTGELGVRPGLIKRNPSGLANGVVHAFGITPVPSNDGFFVQGTAVRTFDIGSGANLKTSATALSVSPTLPLHCIRDTTTTLLANQTDQIYRLTPQLGATLPTVAALTGSPGAGCIAILGERIIAGNINGSFGYRMRFSDAANPNSWPAANFVDIGDGWHIANMHVQRTHLVFVKQSGFLVLTGVPGVNDVLRPVSTQGGGERFNRSNGGYGDLVWWAFGGATGGGWPVSFNGSVHTDYQHLVTAGAATWSSGSAGAAAIPPPVGIAPFSGEDKGVAMIATSGASLLNASGVWSKHAFGVNVTGYVNTDPSGKVYVCDGGAAGATPNFYTWNPLADSPGLESGVDMRAGDDSSTALSGNVTFPEWWATDAAEVSVRSVIVDFRKWNTGSATNNHFDLTVNALRRYQAGAAQASSTVSFDEAAASSSTGGTLERRVFGFGEQGRGNGFQLAFAACKGIAIQRIEIVLDSEQARV